MYVFKAHSKPIYAMEFTPDGRSLVTSSGDELVRLWSGEPLAKVREWPGSSYTSPIAISADGSLLARGGNAGVRVWSIDGSEDPLLNLGEYTPSLSFSPDCRVLASHGNPDQTLALWSIPDGKSLGGGWGGSRASNENQAFPTGVLAYHPSGAMLATVYGVLGKNGFDTVIYLWDTRTGEQVGALRSTYTTSHPTLIRFSPDGTLLAGVYGPILRIWNLARRVEVGICKVGLKHFNGVAFTTDGGRLLSVSNDEMVRVWLTKDWSESSAFAWKIGKLGAVAVSPDGCRFAAGGSTGKVVIWDAD